MSQSTTYYRISKDKFREQETSGGNSFEPSRPQNYITLQGSFMDLEFILSKDQDDSTIEQVKELFNPAEELNSNRIYPEVWHDDNSPDQGFNLRQVSEDFTELKAMIKQAKEEGDYVVVFGG